PELLFFHVCTLYETKRGGCASGAARGDDHGREWAVGRCARASEAGRASGGCEGGTEHRGVCSGAGNRDPDALRVLRGQLEAPGEGGRRADAAVPHLSGRRNGSLCSERSAALRDREARPSLSGSAPGDRGGGVRDGGGAQTAAADRNRLLIA